LANEAEDGSTCRRSSTVAEVFSAPSFPGVEIGPTSVADFLPIHRALHDAGKSFVIIGGQACCLWARYYASRARRLRDLQPYTTKDLDVCAASKDDVQATADALNVAPGFPRKRAASPELGVLKYPARRGEIFVQFLRKGYEVVAEEIIQTQQRYLWKEYNLVLSVMHPLLCLQEKLAASIGLSQEDRQDVKHLRMCMEFVPLFIADRIKDSAPREVLRMCQHILKLAQSTHGRSAFKRFGIEIEKAIPIFHLRRSRVPCLTRFCSEQLPRAVSTIQKRRA
jgi:hypothetical protein